MLQATAIASSPCGGQRPTMEKVRVLLQNYPRVIALIAGGISATGFAPLNLWLLTLLCLALLMHLVAHAPAAKRAFLIGWLFGLGHFTIGNNWIATAFTYQANMPAWLGWLAVPLLALYLAVYPALAAWGAWQIRRLAAREAAGMTLPFILAFAGCWIITEWLRSWVFTGFAWNPLGVIIVNGGWLTKPLAIIGTYGLSGLIILTIGLTILFLRHLWVEIKSKPLTPARIAFIIAFFVLPEATVIALLPYFASPQTATKTGVVVTIVQPNISQIDRNSVGYEVVNFVRLAQNSRAKTNAPRILLWPESAVPWWLEDGYPPYVYRDQPGGSAQATRQVLARLLGPDDILLTGSDRLEFDKQGEVVGARNSVLAIDAKGAIKADYDKAHLVPYGEYLALRWLLEPLGATRLVPGNIDFRPGPGPRTLKLGGSKPDVGLQVCYEIIFSGQVVDSSNRPDFIFNPSNDAWFGTWGPPQHLAQARLRAIEEGLPVVRSTPTGISAIIDANGRIGRSLPMGKAGRIDASLPQAKAPTLFARHGNILPLGFAAMLIALAFLPLVRRRASR
jgi:apolipoprotein N-acyltransferase